MKVIIDTSSLLSLVRYYLPFDQKAKLFDFIKSEFENGNVYNARISSQIFGLFR